MEKIMQFLKENPTFYFASVDGDKPRVRPFGFVMEYQGKLYFGFGSQKAVYRQVKANPNIEVCTASKDGKWIRIRGKAVFDENSATMDKAFELMPMLKNIYSEASGLKMALVYVEDGEAEIMDMTGGFEAIKF